MRINELDVGSIRPYWLGPASDHDSSTLGFPIEVAAAIYGHALLDDSRHGCEVSRQQNSRKASLYTRARSRCVGLCLRCDPSSLRPTFPKPGCVNARRGLLHSATKGAFDSTSIDA